VYASEGALDVAEGDADAIAVTFDILEVVQKLPPPWPCPAVPWLHSLKHYAISQMGNFSHARDGKAIREYVESHFDVSGPSTLEIPLGVHHLISRGI
jgi:hypothetical protein